MPAGWELVGDVVLLKGSKATILYKTQNTSVNWATIWLFKVDGLKLDGTDSFVLQQGPTAGDTPVEVGTFTATSAATDLDTLVSELDTWLRANPTTTGALLGYNWHAEKHVDADGVDSCFIVVDKINNLSRFSPIKSSTSGATATLYMWDWCKTPLNETVIKRKDGVNTFAVLWNKERFKAYNSNINSPSDSLTSPGLFNEAGFNATTTVKGYYGTYDNYLDNMFPDEEALEGMYALGKGKGKKVFESLAEITFPNISGIQTKVFLAESWAKGLKAHSTASVEGLNAGNFFIPSIDVAYKIFSKMKDDGSDPVNSAFVKAGESKFGINVSRWIPGSYINSSYANTWVLNSNGNFQSNYEGSLSYAVAVAEINL
jgi:hypothetical protein